jgi:hypothetical protein
MNLFLCLRLKKEIVLNKPLQELVWFSNHVLSLYAGAT